MPTSNTTHAPTPGSTRCTEREAHMTRMRTIAAGVALALLILMSYCAFVISPRVERADKANRQSADAIVAALEQYRAQNGRYPEKLFELQPRFLARVPVTVRSGHDYRDFTYQTGDSSRHFELSYAVTPNFDDASDDMFYRYDSRTKQWQ